MIKILVTSDIHGRMDRFVPLVQQMKQQQAQLVIDNGDFLQGSAATFYYDHIAKKQHPMLALANELYDVAIFGNHEFDKPIEAIQAMQQACQFPWISCNLKSFAKPYVVKIVEGKKIAIIGATTHYTQFWDEHNYLCDGLFQPALQAVKQCVNYVHTYEKPDYVIVSYHGGFSEDVATKAMYQERIGENEANEMLETISGIDLLITGHQHLIVNELVGNTRVIQPGAQANGFMEVQVSFETDQPISEAIYHPLAAINYSYPSEVEAWLKEPIAYSTHDYTYEGLLQSRLSSHPYIQLIHHMQLQLTKAQISVCDLHYLQRGGFKGEITNADLLKNHPRDYTLKVIELTGDEITQLLEQSAAVLAVDKEGDVDFSTNVYPNTPQPYQYDFWGGISYTFNLSKCVGQRVENVQIEGRPLQANEPYKVAIHSYRLTGYDFPVLRDKHVLFELEEVYPLLVKKYLQNDFPTTNPNYGQFQVVTHKKMV